MGMIPTDGDLAVVAEPDSEGAGQRVADRSLERQLIGMIESHGQREGEALAAYEAMAKESGDEGLKYVVQLIMDDERRHHAQLNEMLHKLQSFVWEVEVKPTVPSLRLRNDPELRRQTEELLAFEKADAKELRQLRKELGRQHGFPLMPLLVDLMIQDTDKHLAILRFIRDRARRR